MLPDSLCPTLPSPSSHTALCPVLDLASREPLACGSLKLQHCPHKHSTFTFVRRARQCVRTVGGVIVEGKRGEGWKCQCVMSRAGGAVSSVLRMAGTVLSLKADAVKEMFAGSINADREAAGLAARIEGCDEDLDDAERVANTGLEVGGRVQLVKSWPHVKTPAVFNPGRDSEDVRDIALSRCGTLCSVGSYKLITVFDTTTADVVTEITQPRAVSCTAFSVCGTWLASCAGHGIIRVWLTATWEEVWCLEDHHMTVHCMSWTHCGRLVSSDANGKVFVWDLEDTPSATVLEGHTRTVYGIAVSTTRIFTGSGDKTICVYDISTLTHTDTLCDHTEYVYKLALSNDEQHLVSSSGDKTLKVWCTTTLTCLRSILVRAAYLVAVSQPGDVVAVCCPVKHTELYSLSTLEHLGHVESKGSGIALSLCGRWVFTPTDNGSVAVRAVCDVVCEDNHLALPSLDFPF